VNKKNITCDFGISVWHFLSRPLIPNLYILCPPDVIAHFDRIHPNSHKQQIRRECTTGTSYYILLFICVHGQQCSNIHNNNILYLLLYAYIGMRRIQLWSRAISARIVFFSTALVHFYYYYYYHRCRFQKYLFRMTREIIILS